jgi:hypothetical protein
LVTATTVPIPVVAILEVEVEVALIAPVEMVQKEPCVAMMITVIPL